MSKSQTRMTKVQKKSDLVHPPEQKPVPALVAGPVQQVAPQPLVDNSAAQAENKLRVNDYLVVHRQFANPNAFQPATLNRMREVNRNDAGSQAGKRAIGR